MFKRIAITGLGIALLSTPFVTSADLMSDLQAQLTALRVQLTSMSANANANAGTNSSAACPSLNAALSVGARGSDVTALQAFLITRGFLSSDSATGYFGPLTQGAVQRFQAHAGVVSSGSPITTGYGTVGRMTREAIRNMCKSISNNPPATSNTNVTFTASPVSGAAPLNVTFTESGLPAGTYGVSFGDGTSGTITVPSILCITAPCTPGPQSTSHTYSAAGSYAVTLSGTPCAVGMSCAQVIRTLGTATITVSGSQTGATFSATPTSGSAPLSVVFTTNVSGATVDFGDGTNASVSANCAIGLDGSNNCNTGSYFTTHSYQTAGTYTATLRGTYCPTTGSACAQVISTLGTATISVGSTSNTAPTISSLSPTQGQVGTQVTISGSRFTSTGNVVTFGSLGQQTVSSSNGTQLTVTIPNDPCPSGAMCAAVMYTTPGTYSLTVTNANGTSNAVNFTVPERTVLDSSAPAPTCSETLSASVVPIGVYFTDSWTSSSDTTSMTRTVTRGSQVVIGPGPTGVSGSYSTKWDVAGTYHYTLSVSNASGVTGQCTTSIVVN